MNSAPPRSAWLRHADVARPWQPVHPSAVPPPPHPRPPWWRLTIAAGLVALWLRLIQLERLERVAPHEGFPLAVALALAFALTFARPLRRRRGTTRWKERLPLFAVVFAFGVIARTLFLTSFPPLDGQLWEECQTGAVAEGSLRSGGLDTFFPITNLLAEAGFRLFGQSMLGLRLPFVLLSIASIPLFFAAARALLHSFAAALMATALFATSAYLAAAGRVALESMAPIATLCAALLATFYTCRTRSLAGFALTGVCAGLLLLEYTSYKLYPPLLFATVALAALRAPPERPGLHHQPAWHTTLWYYRWHFAALLLACGAVVVPVFAPAPQEALHILAEGLTRNRSALAADGSTWVVWSPAALGRVVTACRQVFLGAGSTDLVPPTSGVVDPITGVLGLLALVYCAVTARRDPRRLFLVVALSLTVLFAGLLVDIATRYRITPVPPLYFLAIGVLLDDLFRARPQAAAQRTAAALLIALIAAYNTHYLFNVAMHDPYVLAEFGDPRLALAHEIAAAQRAHPDEPVHIASDCPVMHDSNDYSWLYELDGVHTSQSAADLSAATGTVIADGDFIATVRNLPRVVDCEEFKRQMGNRPLHWMRCRLHVMSDE